MTTNTSARGTRYSTDFRDKVAKYASKYGQHRAAAKFGVSVYSCHKWLHAAGLKPKPVGSPIIHGRFAKKNKATP